MTIMVLSIILVALGYVCASWLFYKAMKADNDSDSVGYMALSGILFGFATLGLIAILSSTGVIPEVFY